MAQTEFVPKTPAQVLEDLVKIAQESGEDFFLKVMRRGSPGTLTPQHVGFFVHATLDHIRSAEAWVGAFAGGGLYTLNVYKGNEIKATLPLSEIAGAPRQPNPAVTKQSTWLGPEYLFPSSEEMNRAAAVMAGDPASAAARGIDTAPNAPGGDGISGLLKELRRREEDLAVRERKLELEGLRREQTEHTARLEARIAELARAAERPAAPAAFDLEKVGGLVMAGLKMWADSAAAARLEEKRLEEERRRQENEHRKEEAERRAASEARYLEMMKQAQARADEQMRHFSGLLEAQAKMSHSSMELQSSIQRNVLQAVADVAQLQLRGDKEEGIDWGKVAREVIGALAAAGQHAAPGPAGVLLPAPGNAPGAAAPPSQAFAGSPPATQEIPEAEVLNAIEDRIRSHDPPDQIAAAVIEAMKTPEAQAELAAFNGDFMALFQDRMQDFIDAKDAKGEQKNGAYLNSLFAELQRQSGQGGASA